MSRIPKWVDEFVPPRGRCGICGGPDARHRLLDNIRGQVKAGEPMEDVATDFEVPLELVQRICKLKRLRQ
jgi:hypothetical protein